MNMKGERVCNMFGKVLWWSEEIVKLPEEQRKLNGNRRMGLER